MAGVTAGQGSPIVQVKSYRARSESRAVSNFQKEAPVLSLEGWVPIHHVWAKGGRSFAGAIFAIIGSAVLLISLYVLVASSVITGLVLVVVAFVLLYIASTGRRPGVLSVTYERRGPPRPPYEAGGPFCEGCGIGVRPEQMPYCTVCRKQRGLPLEGPVAD